MVHGPWSIVSLSLDCFGLVGSGSFFLPFLICTHAPLSIFGKLRILDLTESCDEFFENCSCPDAKRLIDEGKIQCGGESQCPPDCELCSYCLIDVLECYEEE